MKKSYRYIVVEDVALQRENLISLLSSRLDLQLLDSFENAEEAYDYLASNPNPRPDLMFLDIEMPEVNGFSLLDATKRFRKNIKIIITSAFPKYAIQGYDYDVTAYLLKPIEMSKLNQAVDKALSELEQPKTAVFSKATPANDHLVIKVKNKWVKIFYNEIIYCEGANVNIKIITPIEEYLTREKVKNLEQKLPSNHFLRIHDSFIINLDYVKGYAKTFAFVDLWDKTRKETYTLNVGPKYREVFKARMLS